MLGTGFSISTLAVRCTARHLTRFILTELLPSNSTFTRASSALVRDASGAFIGAAANEPRFDHDETGAALGVFLEGAATNLSDTVNINPTDSSSITLSGHATLTVVDDAAALDSAGLLGVCTSGKVYKFDGSSASGNSFAIIAQSTSGALQTVSAWVRGAGLFAILGEHTSSFTSAQYARISLSHTSNSNRNVAIRVNPGQTCYFILQQFETKDQPSSEVLSSSTSAVTRAQDVLTLPVPDGMQDITLTYHDGSEELFAGQTVSGGWLVPISASGKRIKQVSW